MIKHIFIVNGSGGCGKDTFASLLNEIVPVYKYSSIDKVKQIATMCGWTGSKEEKDRKFLSDLKLLTTEYNDMAFEDIRAAVLKFGRSKLHKIMLIDIREPAEIERAKQAFGAKTILIKSNRVPVITSNMADANVFNYEYDYEFDNSGTIEDLREKVIEFAADKLGYKCSKLDSLFM